LPVRQLPCLKPFVRKKNLILTVMHGYDYPFVEPFIRSLQSTGCAADLVIFISDKVSKTTKRVLKKRGAILIEFTSKYPFIPSYRADFENMVSTITINNYRFIFYLRYLLEAGKDYQDVMLTDIRDVIFQRNPFGEDLKGNICFFLEDPVQTFSYSELNYKWLTDATDAGTASKFINDTVSCAGVTIGGVSRIIDYLKYIKSKLDFRAELPWGLDQGIHNSYVYNVKPAGMVVYKSEHPFVYNMGAYQVYKLNSKNEVVNKEDKPYQIIHQYDRFGELLELMKSKYTGNRLMQKFKRAYFALMP